MSKGAKRGNIDRQIAQADRILQACRQRGINPVRALSQTVRRHDERLVKQCKTDKQSS